MSKTRRLVLLVFLLIVMPSMIYVCLKHPYFWPVAVVPGLFFLTGQAIALSTWKRKQRLFAWTDYLHYGLIGATVAIASQYVVSRELIAFYEVQEDRPRLEAEILRIDLLIPTLQERLTQLQDWNPDEAAIEKCAPFALAPRIESFAESKFQRGVREHCDMLIADTLRKGAEKESLPGQIESLRMKRDEAVTKIRDVSKATWPLERPNLGWRLVIIPSMLLCGAAIKLGKTTANIAADRA